MLEALKRSPEVASWLVVIDDGKGYDRAAAKQDEAALKEIGKFGNNWDTLYEDSVIEDYQPGATLIYVGIGRKRASVDESLWELPMDENHPISRNLDGSAIYAIKRLQSRGLAGNVVVQLTSEDRQIIAQKVEAAYKANPADLVVPLGQLMSRS